MLTRFPQLLDLALRRGERLTPFVSILVLTLHSTAKRIIDPGDGRAIYIVGILPVLYVTTQIPEKLKRWTDSFQTEKRMEFRLVVDAIAYVAQTASIVASMTASTMIGELVSNFGEDEPGWWVLIITALFLAVLHLGKNALLETTELEQAELWKRNEQQQKDEQAKNSAKVEKLIKSIEEIQNIEDVKSVLHGFIG